MNIVRKFGWILLWYAVCGFFYGIGAFLFMDWTGISTAGWKLSQWAMMFVYPAIMWIFTAIDHLSRAIVIYDILFLLFFALGCFLIIFRKNPES